MSAGWLDSPQRRAFIDFLQLVETVPIGADDSGAVRGSWASLAFDMVRAQCRPFAWPVGYMHSGR
jgi:hypothetical protein